MEKVRRMQSKVKAEWGDGIAFGTLSLIGFAQKIEVARRPR